MNIGEVCDLDFYGVSMSQEEQVEDFVVAERAPRPVRPLITRASSSNCVPSEALPSRLPCSRLRFRESDLRECIFTGLPKYPI